MRRAGSFCVDTRVIEQRPELVADLLSGMIVLRAEHDFCSDRINYTALSAKFAEVYYGAS